MKILKLEIESFKRVAAVTIEPDSNMVVIGGRNGAGKSSTLDAIEAAIGGKRHVPDTPIKQGEEKARIVLETDDLVVTRTFSDKGTYLKVASKENGATFQNPQALLDKLVGPISFDPVSFIRQPPTKQAQTICTLAGIDPTEHEAQRKEIYAARTAMGRDLRRLQAELASLPEVPTDTPDKPLSVSALIADHQAAVSHNADNEHRRAAVDVAETAYARADSYVRDLEEQIERARASRDEAKAVLDAAKADAAGLQDKDIDNLMEQIEQAEAVNKRVTVAQRRAKLADLAGVTETAVSAATAELTQLDKQHRKTIEDADYPIDGLCVDGDQVTFEGLSLSQASSAAQLRISTAIALTINPKLKVALIRDGSLLDADNLRAVAEVAAQHDAQVWIERVSDGDEVSVVIEDGMVVPR